MAYVFKRIEEQVNPGARQSDALLNPQAQQGPTSGNIAGKPEQGTSSGGLAIDSGSSGNASLSNKAEQGVSKDQYTKVNYADPRLIVERNRGAQSADVTSNIRQGIQNTQKELKDKAATFTQNLVKPHEISASNISAAVNAGDKDATANIQKALSQNYDRDTTSDPSRQKDFEFADYNPMIKTAPGVDPITETQALKTFAGTQTALKQRGGSGYTGGMANLDAQLAWEDPQYKQKIADAEAGIRKMNAEIADTKYQTGKSVDAARAAVDTNRTNLKNTLTNMGTSLESEIAGRLPEAQNQRMMLADNKRLGLTQDYNKRLDDAKAEVEKRLTAYDPGSGVVGSVGRSQLQKALDSIEAMRGDSGKYVNVDPGNLSLADVTSQDESQRFGRIMQLLGKGDNLASSTPAEIKAGMDEAALNAALDQIYGDALKYNLPGGPAMYPGAPTADPGTTTGAQGGASAILTPEQQAEAAKIKPNVDPNYQTPMKNNTGKPLGANTTSGLSTGELPAGAVAVDPKLTPYQQPRWKNIDGLLSGI